MWPAKKEPGGERAAMLVKRWATRASVLLRSSEKRAKGRVPPSGLGACAVADVVVAGATWPIAKAADANPWARA